MWPRSESLVRLRRHHFTRASPLVGNRGNAYRDGFLLLYLGKRRQFARSSVSADDNDFLACASVVEKLKKVFSGVRQIVGRH